MMLLLLDERLPWPDAAWSLSEHARRQHVTAVCYRVALAEDGRCEMRPVALVNQQPPPALEEFLQRHRQQVEQLDIVLFQYSNDTRLFQAGRRVWELTADTLSIRLIGFVLSTENSSQSWHIFDLGYSEMITEPHGGRKRRIFDSIFLPTSLDEKGQSVPPEKILACGEHLFHAATVGGSELFAAMGAFQGTPDEPSLIGYGMRSWAPTAADCLRLAKDVLPLLVEEASRNQRSETNLNLKDLLSSHTSHLPYDSSGKPWTESLPDPCSLTGKSSILKALGLPEDFDDLTEREKLASCEGDILYHPQCFDEKAGFAFAQVSSRIEELVRQHRRSLMQLSSGIRSECLQRLTHAEVEFAKALVAPRVPESILNATESIDLSVPCSAIAPCPQLNEPTPSTIRANLKDRFETCRESLRKKLPAGMAGLPGRFFQNTSKRFYMHLIAPVYAVSFSLFSVGFLTGTTLVINSIYSFFYLPPDFPWTTTGAILASLSALLLIMIVAGKRLSDEQLRLFQEMRDELENCLNDNLHRVRESLNHPLERLIRRETLLFSRLFAYSAGPTVATLRRIVGLFVTHGKISVDGQRILSQLDERTRQRLRVKVGDLVKQLLEEFSSGKPAEQIEAMLEAKFLQIGADLLDLGVRNQRTIYEHAVQQELGDSGPPIWAPFDHGEMNVGVSRVAVVEADSEIARFFPPTAPDSRYEKQTTLEIPKETRIPPLLVKTKRLVTPDQFRRLYSSVPKLSQQ